MLGYSRTMHKFASSLLLAMPLLACVPAACAPVQKSSGNVVSSDRANLCIVRL
jgi:hypothetical protein